MTTATLTEAERDRQQRVAAAECYVRTRFYPPLPYQYGEYAVQAVEACNEGETEREILLDPDLPLHPRSSHHDDSGSISTTAADLVDALRLWHMVEDEEPAEHDCEEFAVEEGGPLQHDGGFEVWTACEKCGRTWDRGFDSVL